MGLRPLVQEQRTSDDTKRVAGIIVVREQPDGTHRVLALLPGKEVTSDTGETRYEFYRNWDIPKGHGKGGESAMTIAMREAGEEAGYTTDNLDFRWGTQSKAATGKKGKTGTFFVAHSDVDPALKRNPENNMLEHGGFKWVTWDDMLGNVGRFWFSDAIAWARNLVDSPAADGLEESLLRNWVREILAEAPRRGKRHDAARREREELESQGIFPTEEEKPKETKRDLWHIGPKPAFPQPKVKLLQDWDPEAIGRDGEKGDFVSIPGTDNWQRWWLDSPVKAGVFLTPTPTDIARYHGRSGNVYHYKVPEWVIDKAKGIHRYDHGSEVLISKEIWDEAGDEIEFIGTSMTKDQLWQKIRDLGGYDFGGRVMPPGKSKTGSFNLYGLRQTKHPRDAIKLMTDKERQAALAALEDLYPAPTGQNPEIKWEKVPGGRRGIPLNWFEERMSKKDLELRDLLLTSLKSVNEAMIRHYVREMLLEKASDGRTIDRVTQVKFPDTIPEDLLDLGNEDTAIQGFVHPKNASKKRAGIYIGDDLVGFMTPREEPDGGWRVGAIYIRPENRGEGIAPSAIAKFFEDKDASPVPIGLTNSSSQSAFAKAGFTPLDPDKVLTDESDG